MAGALPNRNLAELAIAPSANEHSTLFWTFGHVCVLTDNSQGNCLCSKGFHPVDRHLPRDVQRIVDWSRYELSFVGHKDSLNAVYLIDVQMKPNFTSRLPPDSTRDCLHALEKVARIPKMWQWTKKVQSASQISICRPGNRVTSRRPSDEELAVCSNRCGGLLRRRQF